MATETQSAACCVPTCCDTAAPQSPDELRALVREQYAQVATRQTGCCGSTASNARTTSQGLGYTAETLDAVPEAANLGVGCGNPNAISALQPGEVVVDLGAGAGLDALIAAQAVGPTGRVIGVDMTPEMLTSARANAVTMGVHGFVEFREGLIEDMPVSSGSADVIISNCVINLSPDKPAAFREAFRVLKPGGRLAVSDIVLSEALPEDARGLADAYVACVAGAATEDTYLGAIRAAGFEDVEFTRTSAMGLFDGDSADPLVQQGMAVIGAERVAALARTVWSYQITARKPASR
jgi:SAM-dependent methyltransferase